MSGARGTRPVLTVRRSRYVKRIVFTGTGGTMLQPNPDRTHVYTSVRTCAIETR